MTSDLTAVAEEESATGSALMTSTGSKDDAGSYGAVSNGDAVVVKIEGSIGECCNPARSRDEGKRMSNRRSLIGE